MWLRRVGVVTLFLTSIAVITACGSDDSAPGGGTGATSGASGTGGSAGSAGSGGSAAAGAGGGGAAGGCPSIAPPKGGSVLSALVPVGSTNAIYLDVACDGSFVVTGSYANSLSVSFARADGSSIELGPAPSVGGRRPDAHFIARFDANGHALWASNFWMGDAGGAGQQNVPKLFPDGSVALGGFFGTQTTLGVGQAHETTLTTIEYAIEGYIARYDANGMLLWAKKVSGAKAMPDSSTEELATAPDSTTYATVAAYRGSGLTVGQGEIDMGLLPYDQAVVALDRNGRFTRGVLFQGMRYAGAPRMRVLPDGDVLVVSTFDGGAILAPGTPQEITVAESSLGYARLSSSLELKSLTLVKLPASAFYSVPLPDGSVVFENTTTGDLTLGAGEPNEVTFKPAAFGVEYGFVARFGPDGRLMRATQMTHARALKLTAVAALPDGSAWVMGYVPKNVPDVITFGPGTARPLTLATDEHTTHFAARFNPDGTPAWAIPFSGDMFLHFSMMAASPLETVLVGEKDPGSITFGKNGPTISDSGAVLLRLGP